MSHHLAAAAFAVLLSTAATAQEAPTAQHTPAVPGRLQTALDKAATAVEELHSKLPSFTCVESGYTDRTRPDTKTGELKHKARVDFAGDLTVRPGESGDLHERLHLTQRKGKPFDGDAFDLPYFVAGGFQQALDFFGPGRRSCYDFTLENDNRITFHDTSSSEGQREVHSGCGDETGMNGFALLDAEANIVHVERTFPPDVAHKLRLAPFAAIDLAPVELDSHTYRLSSHIGSAQTEGRDTRHFEATYTACHLFKTTITIHPGSRPVDESPETPSPKDAPGP